MLKSTPLHVKQSPYFQGDDLKNVKQLSIVLQTSNYRKNAKTKQLKAMVKILKKS